MILKKLNKNLKKKISDHNRRKEIKVRIRKVKAEKPILKEVVNHVRENIHEKRSQNKKSMYKRKINRITKERIKRELMEKISFKKDKR